MQSDLIHVATVDVVRGQEDAFNRWYNDVHLPEMMGCPGWLNAKRFECTDGQPRFLAIYELSGEQLAFSTPEYERAFGWDEFAFYIRNSHSRNYRLIYETAGGAEEGANTGLIHVATVDVVRGQEDAFNRWYNDVHLPEMMGCPGWLNAKRFECTDGQPRFLAIYELSGEQLAFSTPEYERAFGWDEFAFYIRNSHSRNYRLIYETAASAER